MGTGPEMAGVSRTSAVIGGGISGITAALELSKAGDRVHLFEKAAQFGGKIAETEVNGITIPTGPDNFLARRTEVFELASELGLDDRLISPSAGSARIYRDGRLHPLPPNVLGVPATTELSGTGLISEFGSRRAAEDLAAADDRTVRDESVGSLIRRRLGDEVLEYLVDPLLGGINAGDSDRLSLQSGTPQLAQLRAKHPSLTTAAKMTLDERPPNPGPVFSTIDGGMARLVDHAVSRLTDLGVTIHLGTNASIDRQADGWSVSSHPADRVVIATPSFVAADLVRGFAPALSGELAGIDYSSVGVTIFVLPPNTLSIDRSISGVLVPRACGFTVTAISFASHKWPAMAGDDQQILRVSVGRRTDARWRQLAEEDLVELVRAEASEILGQAIPPCPSSVALWPQSLPQYDVDHADRVARIERQASQFDGLSFVGAWKSGLGLPACVATGRAVVSTGR